MRHANSARIFKAATAVIPGGVNSPVRAFGAVGGTPVVIARGHGARVYDADGNEYIDYVGSWGPLILGHAHPTVVAAVTAAAKRGTSFGAPTEAEVRLAQLITAAYPAAEKVRLVSSGTEATMTALRLARAYTGRDTVLKFAGCYHGHSDCLLAKGGSGLMTLAIPSTPGVPKAFTALTAVLPYNDLAAVERFAKQRKSKIAAIIVEPIAANMGVVPPAKGFLEGLRKFCDRTGALLIFDEVITGFRVAWGGAAELYGVRPDLVTFGKIIGGGLPVGAYGGRRDIMDLMAPVGNVYQAGTLSGNPIATAAGIATLEALKRPGTYAELERKSRALEEGLREAFASTGVAVTLTRVGSLLTAFFAKGAVTDYASAGRSDSRAYARFFHGMLERGVYLAPSQFEAAFVSLAHTAKDIERTVKAAAETLSSGKQRGTAHGSHGKRRR
jgi:glutamate-1-semialdehyde 2,1-aminomutase